MTRWFSRGERWRGLRCRLGAGFSIAAVALLAAALGAVTARGAEGDAAANVAGEIPRPALVHLEQPIQDQLRRERRLLDDAVGADTAPDELAAAYARVGQLYFLYDLLESAQAAFTAALELRPEQAEWWHYRGVIDRFEGRLEQAQAAFTRALELAPLQTASAYRLGDVELELGRFDAALATFEELVAKHPQEAAAHHGLGRAQAGLGEHLQAVRSFERALELQPEATSIHHALGLAYRALGDRDEARRHLALNQHGEVALDDPLVSGLADLVAGGSVHLKLGNEAMQRGEPAIAAEQYRLAARGNPRSALIRYNLGTALLQMGDRERAERELTEALRLDPDHRDAHYNLGVVRFQDARYEQAEEHFRRVHEIDPVDRRAHLDWAVALSRTGRYEQAVTELTQLVTEDPRNVEAIRNLGRALVATGGMASELRRLEQELAAAEAAAAGDAAAILFRRGTYLELLESTEAALAAFEEAVAADPGYGEAFKSLGRLRGRSGRMAAAESALRQAVALDPEDSEAHTLLVWSIQRQERYDDARLLLRERLEQYPQEVAVAHQLARLLASCPDDAIRNGERALRMAVAVFQIDRTVAHGETVAMALAETGRFDEAIEFQRRVIELATQQESDNLELLSRRLAALERGERIRAPWMESSE